MVDTKTESSKEKPVFVATYGSLRRNMSNHLVNDRADATLVGLGLTDENYDLYAYCSSFPSVSLTHSESGAPVRVEVYETTEEGLTGPYDRLEGFPHFYNRSEILVNLDDGNPVIAWIYHIDQKQSVRVSSGDWCTYKCGDNYYDYL